MDPFVTQHYVIAMISEKVKKATVAMVVDSITGTVEDVTLDLVKVGYTSAKE